MANEQPKPTLTQAANENFSLDLTQPEGAAPLATTAPVAVAAANAGGLSYATATPEEKVKMDAIIKSIDLKDPETVVSIGTQERQKLADLADAVLNSIQPEVKMAFVQALAGLIDVVKANSLDDIKKRVKDSVSPLKAALWGLFDTPEKKEARELAHNKEMIQHFMTDITGTRKTIQEMVQKLQDQQVELNKNYNRINQLGHAITESAQDMRVVRAATAEYIRRVDAGEITTLIDLEKKAQETKRAEDLEILQTAQANWGNLRVVDGDLLASIGVYDMNVANLAFTKQANLQNRMQTATTLTTTVSEWKTELAVFGTVMVEKNAARVLDAAAQLTKASVAKNTELFDELVDITVERSAKGAYTLRDIIEAQGHMAAKLEGIGAKVEENFAHLAADKIALAESSQKFRQTAVNAFSKPGGILGTAPAAARPKLTP